ncbi:MAG: amino acid adenylation domain-containing protein, partial [Acidobacteriota bacterium]
IEAADGSPRDLTYADLGRRSAQLAHLLAARGIDPSAGEQRVGLAIERSLELIVAVFATLRAGATFVPLDVSYPEDRLRFMAEDADLSLILTQPAFASRISQAVSVATLAIDSEWTVLDAQPDHLEDELPARQQAAYMIYTSGSTGRPKGVVNTHGALANRLAWMQRRYPLEVGDRVLQKTPISFDVSVWELVWPFMTGAGLVMARPGGHQEPAYLAEILDRQEISTVHFVPSMLRAFLAEPNADQPCRQLRQVIASGEALPTELVDRFFERFDSERVALDNLYGPTEAAIDVTWHRCSTDEQGSVPIGAPIDNLALHVVTPFLQIAPRGASGELLIGGAGLARGYHGRPGLTAERFVPDAWSPEPGARLYRTGDLARWQATGELDFLGRLDFQIKLHGVRIELGEIEAVLEEYPGVDAVAVTAEDGERLVAYVVADEDLPEIRALRKHLQSRLPETMMPSEFIALDALPLSPNGKIDRRALAEAGGVRIEHRVPYEAPRTELEEELATLFAEILGREKIGIHDPFFELGGNSLNVTQLLSRVRQSYRIELSLSSFFEGPNVARLALGIEAAQRAAASLRRERSNEAGREVGAL